MHYFRSIDAEGARNLETRLTREISENWKKDWRRG